MKQENQPVKKASGGGVKPLPIVITVIAVDMFLNLATTNVTEASELLNNLWPAIILVCVIYIPTIVIAASISSFEKCSSSEFFSPFASVFRL